MNVDQKNHALLDGNLDLEGLFPRLELLKKQKFVFKVQFGLDQLPLEPGLLVIRGARQYGKSTWLEQQLSKTIKDFGPGSALFLNGDEIENTENLYKKLVELLSLFSNKTKIRRLFIDEITNVKNWEKVLKRIYDEGLSTETLIITTGSKMTDLRRGTERLPGRKGKLSRTQFVFLPISYNEFVDKTFAVFKDNVLSAFLLSGGSPIAANELAVNGFIPEYVFELVRDWIFGECAASGRSKETLLWLLHAIHIRACTPVSMTKLAKESGAANNTVIQGYVDLLKDLGCLSSSFSIDKEKLTPIPRKESKLHFINLLAASTFDSNHIRNIHQFNALTPTIKSKWFEWSVASELWRRAALEGGLTPETQFHWQGDGHEIDFVIPKTKKFIEVKLGASNPLDFVWFHKIFPKDKLEVITTSSFSTRHVFTTQLEDFFMNNTKGPN